MTKDAFLADDRFCSLSNSDIACAGDKKHLAIARLLDSESDSAFCAVLDTDGETVWTADGEERDADGLPVIVWEPLAEFTF
jgi:hypothetical protein